MTPHEHSRSSETRSVWQLVSPDRRPVFCEVRRVDDGFELAVTAGDHIFLSKRPTLQELHATATRWRAALELKGFQPISPVA